MTEQPTNGLVCGYTTQEHLLMDLDNSSAWKAEKIAKMIMQEWHDVGDCLIVESSPKHHHLIFDSKMVWRTIHDMIMTLQGVGIVEDNFGWIRELRHDLTLRISPKPYVCHVTPQPQIVTWITNPHWTNNREGMIKKYINCLAAFNSQRLSHASVHRTSCHS